MSEWTARPPLSRRDLREMVDKYRQEHGLRHVVLSVPACDYSEVLLLVDGWFDVSVALVSEHAPAEHHKPGVIHFCRPLNEATGEQAPIAGTRVLCYHCRATGAKPRCYETQARRGDIDERGRAVGCACCPHCEGTGTLPAEETVAKLRRYLADEEDVSEELRLSRDAAVADRDRLQARLDALIAVRSGANTDWESIARRAATNIPADSYRILCMGYDFNISTDGFLAALTAGDHGWEWTALRMQPDIEGLAQAEAWMQEATQHKAAMGKLQAMLPALRHALLGAFRQAVRPGSETTKDPHRFLELLTQLNEIWPDEDVRKFVESLPLADLSEASVPWPKKEPS